MLIICRAMCAFSTVKNAILPIVPLQVKRRSPEYAKDLGSVVQRFIMTDPFSRLLAPVIYGIPLQAELNLSVDKS